MWRCEHFARGGVAFSESLCIGVEDLYIGVEDLYIGVEDLCVLESKICVLELKICVYLESKICGADWMC